jgi:hypothetical protein
MDNNTKKFKISNLNNDEMFRSLRGMFGDSGKIGYYISLQQNDFKERALALYEEFKKNYKRGHYAQLYFNRISYMDLEEEAHRFGLSMTFSTLSEFSNIDKDILDQNMRIVTESPKNFISAMIDVLGKETDESQLPPEIVQRLLDLYSLLEQRWKNHENTSQKK